MFRLLRDLVAREQSRKPSITTGRVEAADAGHVDANVKGMADNAERVSIIGAQDVGAGTNGLFLHLDGLQAFAFWQVSNVSTGGADPPVHSV